MTSNMNSIEAYLEQFNASCAIAILWKWVILFGRSVLATSLDFFLG